MLTFLTSLLWETWNVLLVAAPFLLLGLFAGGLLHVLLSRRLVERWMGQEGLLGVVVAALFGIPLPLCSCGVVPVAMALRRKGASRPATASFLITTPESGVDSIVLTYGMLGPVMALARPLASFVTAVVAGIAVIAWPDAARAAALPAASDPHPHGHDETADEAHVVGVAGFWRALRVYLAPRRRGAEDAAPVGVRPFETVMADAFRYGFIDLLDDIVFWLVIGLGLAALISLAVPDDLAAWGLGGGLAPMLLMLLIGVPLYICASASTPVAAALIAKGMSPGAALVFLLAGPGTNAATIVLLTREFGPRFVRLYVASIAIGALACGLALDALLALTGWRVAATLSGGLGGVALVQWLCAAGLAGLMAWRLWAGAARQGLHELVENTDSLLGLAADADAAARRARWRRAGRRAVQVGAALVVFGWLAAGVRMVPTDARGFGFLFGRLAWPDLAPGLHYVPPWPLGRMDVWRIRYPRLASVGFQPDLQAFANRRQLTRLASANLWHSPVTASNGDPQTATYLTGDENLVEISFAVQYDLSDPEAYFYGVDKDRDSVRLYAETAAREFVATRRLDALLTAGRAEFETAVAERLQAHLDRIGAGVRVGVVLVVDLHPPQGAVDAFRDVSSAREDRETAINVAATAQAREIPLARGQAALTRATAHAGAVSAELEARGRAEAFSAEAAAYAGAPALLGDLLWLENAERVLAGRDKLIVPSGSGGRQVAVWQTAPGTAPPGAPQPAPRGTAPDALTPPGERGAN